MAIQHRAPHALRDERRLAGLGLGVRPLECKPVEVMRAERHEVRGVGDLRESLAAEQLDGRDAAQLVEVEPRDLHEPRQVRDHEHALAFVLADEREHVRVVAGDELDRAAPEQPVLLALRDEALGPPQQRLRVRLLRLDVDRFVVILGIDDRRQVELLRVRARESAVAVGAPLHRRAHPVAIAEVDVVAHPDLVAVIEDRRAGQREQQRVHQLDLAAHAEQRCQPAADAEVDPRAALVRRTRVYM